MSSDDAEHRTTEKTIRITVPCHDRINDLRRGGERQSDLIMRAMDALEREQQLPAAVTRVLQAEDAAGVDAPRDANGDPVFDEVADDA
mgnify:FL=1